jgi:hypothetical protein
LIALGATLGRLQTFARDLGRADPVSLVLRLTIVPVAAPLARAADNTRDFLVGMT